ncbi:MAG: indolepyruvate ferredoxin oxidoreductase subunit alpha, partial [Carboxydocellales bacterium]
MGSASAKERKLFTGNHAIVRGAWEAGVTFIAGYPGTPATEIIEIAADDYDDIHAQWGANEKVAFDEAMAYAINGKRSMVSMKYVGLNVAADSFMVMPFGGTVGGFVIVSADDPGMHSSQNEQDNRYFAKIAKMPMIEPSDAQEAKDFIKVAYEVSEQFNTPVLFRTSMRINHTKCVVEMGERVDFTPKTYTPDIPKWVVPVFAKQLKPILDEKMEKLANFSETFSLNRLEQGTADFGVITSGISYQYAKEVFPDANYLKLAMTYPLPKQQIIDFCKRFDKVYIIEELEPFMEEQIRFWGINNLIGKEVFPSTGELSVEVLEEVLDGIKAREGYG